MLAASRFLSFSCWLLLRAGSAAGLEFRLGSCFQPGMVLQSSDQSRGVLGAKLWGWGQPGADIDVELSDGSELGRSRVGGEGWWSVTVRLDPGGPYNLTVHHRYPASSSSAEWRSDCRGSAVLPQRVQLDDVLAGDVWLCVGSDNLALPMSGLANSSAEIAASLNFTSVRFAQLREAWTEEPQVRTEDWGLTSLPPSLAGPDRRFLPALERPQPRPPGRGLRHLLDVRPGAEPEVSPGPRGSPGRPRQQDGHLALGSLRGRHLQLRPGGFLQPHQGQGILGGDGLPPPQHDRGGSNFLWGPAGRGEEDEHEPVPVSPQPDSQYVDPPAGTW